jgi:hypothetical protein
MSADSTQRNRREFLYGVQTLKHTAAFRGNYYSYLMALDAGYHLSIQLLPKFRTSVVEVAGSRYITLAYNTTNGFMAITFEDNKPMKRAILNSFADETCNPPPLGTLILWSWGLQVMEGFRWQRLGMRRRFQVPPSIPF